jgi:hypothetical protein
MFLGGAGNFNIYAFNDCNLIRGGCFEADCSLNSLICEIPSLSKKLRKNYDNFL